MKLLVNNKAPAFSAPDQSDIIHTLADYRGQWLLLYFYPKDDTPGCTTEACSLRDSLPNFKKLDLAVLGVSVDSVGSHEKFSRKYRLTFPLLADADKKIVNAYGVWRKKKMMGRTYDGRSEEHTSELQSHV